MKKSIKLISLFIIALITVFIGKETVFAADASPATLSINAHKMTSKPLGLTQLIHVKKTADGKYVYCFDAEKKIPTSSISYAKSNLITDPAISYIIASGYDDKTDEDFFATQAALWIYLVDTNQKQDTSTNYIQKIKTAVYSSANANNEIAKDIKNILENILDGAKKATQSSKPVLQITTVPKDVSFTLKNGVYVSNVIKVDTNLKTTDYDVLLYNQPEGTKINHVSGGFTISIPEENVKVGETTMEVTLRYSTTVYNVYKYTPSNSNYQNMLSVYPETVNLSTEVYATVEKNEEEPEDPTVIRISKQDITTEKELPGATLIVRDSDGDIIDKWVSTTKPHVLDELKPGRYTLEEIVAPEGYELSSEKINFIVREDGRIKTVTMYNTPKKVEEPKEIVVSISKQDITTKEEVPGATLIIRNSEGKEIYRWISGDEPYIIKGIEEGTYTLEEIIAPEGYILSNEKITFEVKNNGVVTEVVMFNTPEPTDVIVVPPTGTFASTIGYILGGLVIIIGSVLIYRNVKKEQ